MTPNSTRYTFHILPNAHLDPVWLWDWQEGLNEGIATVRSVLKLMARYPKLTFIRGESSIYEHLAAYAPDCMTRIHDLIKAGRWDAVGSTYVQCDTNMTSTEAMARQFQFGQSYLQQTFGKPARVAWWPDSFGHSAGLPNILAAAGIEGLAISRPFVKDLPLPKPAVWWQGSSGARILTYRMPVGWYGSDRHQMPERLDEHLAAADANGLHHIGVFMGLGNHGGGPCEQQLDEIAAWSEQHPEVTVIYSTLHRFIDALKGEDLPTFRGEMNFCLRGCYTSVAKHKSVYRRAEAETIRAEVMDTAVHSLLAGAPADQRPTDLRTTWKSVLFNSFHDILPGTSIERAHVDQLHWTGGAIHEAQKAAFRALNHLGDAVDTTVPEPLPYKPGALPILVYNPHPVAYKGPVELKLMIDWRPINEYPYHQIPLEVRGPDHELVRYQSLTLEDEAIGANVTWRKRVLIKAELPPCGWAVYTVGYVEGAKAFAPTTAIKTGKNWIANREYKIQARTGAAGVQIWHRERKLFSGPGLSAITVDDPDGSWGSGAVNHSELLHEWKVVETHLVEKGDLAATLWVRLEGGRSSLELRFTLHAGRAAIDTEARVQWHERAARLKLVMPARIDQGDFEVPGAVIRRGELGEVPALAWVNARSKSKPVFGFASDLIYGFDIEDGALRASIVRSTRYACGHPEDARGQRWIPCTDQGEHTFKFLITPGDRSLPQKALLLQQPPLAQIVPASSGRLNRSGSALSFSSTTLRLLALTTPQDGNGVIMRVQETGSPKKTAVITWLDGEAVLEPLRTWEIATLRLHQVGTRLEITPVTITD